jgi:hypothetical protein
MAVHNKPVAFWKGAYRMTMLDHLRSFAIQSARRRSNLTIINAAVTTRGGGLIGLQAYRALVGFRYSESTN